MPTCDGPDRLGASTQAGLEVGGWEADVDTTGSAIRCTGASRRRESSLDMGKLQARANPARDEGCQVRVYFRALHLMASCRVSSSASSLRKLWKALFVLLLTVPRGMPLRLDISL